LDSSPGSGWTAGLHFFWPLPWLRDHLLPSHKVGIISLVALAVAILARYALHFAGAWRWIYVVSAVMALYLNVFVLVAQLFEKVGALKALAPTQKEPPFLIAQLVVLVLFAGLAVLAVKGSTPSRHGRVDQHISCCPRSLLGKISTETDHSHA